MKTIIIPTDFSLNAQKAADFAVNMFIDETVNYELLNVYHVPSANATTLTSIEDVLEKDSKDDCAKEQSRLKDKFELDQSNLNAVSRLGFLPDILGMEAKDKDAYMIVMGTTGASGLKEKVIGSNAAAAVKESNIPVLVIPVEAELKALNNIVIALNLLDDIDVSKLDAVADIARKFNATVTVVDIVKNESDKNKVLNSSNKILIEEFFEDIVVSVDVVVSDDTVGAIETFVQAKHANLLATSPKSYGFFENLFHSSVSGKLIMHTKIPVLALK